MKMGKKIKTPYFTSIFVWFGFCVGVVVREGWWWVLVMSFHQIMSDFVTFTIRFLQNPCHVLLPKALAVTASLHPPPRLSSTYKVGPNYDGFCFIISIKNVHGGLISLSTDLLFVLVAVLAIINIRLHQHVSKVSFFFLFHCP